MRLGHAGIVDHSVDLSTTYFKKKYEKGMDRSNKKNQDIIQMHNSKYQCHMAACCTYHRPTYFSQLLNRSHTKKAYLLTKTIEEFSGKSSEERTSRQKMITQKEEVCQSLFCPNRIIILCDLQIDHIFHITLIYIIFQCDDAIVPCFFCLKMFYNVEPNTVCLGQLVSRP